MDKSDLDKLPQKDHSSELLRNLNSFCKKDSHFMYQIGLPAEDIKGKDSIKVFCRENNLYIVAEHKKQGRVCYFKKECHQAIEGITSVAKDTEVRLENDQYNIFINASYDEDDDIYVKVKVKKVKPEPWPLTVSRRTSR